MEGWEERGDWELGLDNQRDLSQSEASFSSHKQLEQISVLPHAAIHSFSRVHILIHA